MFSIPDDHIGNMYESAYQDIFVNPLYETPMAYIQRGEFAIRYLYSRSSESQNANITGQDTIRFRYNDNKVVFAVCDGVGQSFNGQLASQFLGDSLVKWLWDLPEETLLDERAFPIKVRECLNDLIEEATKVVESYSIPQNAPKVVINVLEEMRLLGSETTFVCGCVILPNDKLPDGRIAISWLGDTVFRLWDKNGQLINLSTKFITREHWSTRKGLQGKKPYAWTKNLLSVGRLAVFSDGLMPIQDLIEQVVENEIINDSALAISKSGAGDDLSYWEMNMEHQEIVQNQKPKQPIFDHIHMLPEGIEIHWQGATSVPSYKLFYSIDGVMDEKTIHETEYIIRIKRWKTIKFGIRSKVGNLLSDLTTLEFTSEDDERMKLIISVLVVAGATVLGYLFGQGR